MKKLCLNSLTLLLITLFIVFNLSASTELPKPEQLLKELNTALKNIESYSYTIYQEGWDVFTKESEKKAREEYSKEAEKKYSKAADKYRDTAESQLPEEKEKPIFKKSIMEYKFMKPYLLQMTVIDSDYVPDFLNNSKLTYRPDNDPKVVWFKFKYLPFALKRDVEGEYGSFFTANWQIALMILDYYSKNAEIKVEGIEDYKGNEAYKVVFTFNVKTEADVKKYEIDYKKWGIPIETKYKVDKTLEVLPRQKFSSITYWIDVKRKIILGREEYIGGKLHWREWYENIKLNHLTKKDF